MAIVIAYDDSDGWYDHQYGPLVNQSADAEHDVACGDGSRALGGFQGRCGYGVRLPLLVISPYARSNFVDHTVTDQTSILRFIEDNWHLPRIGGGSFDALAGPLDGLFDFAARRRPPLYLDPVTGRPSGGS